MAEPWDTANSPLTSHRTDGNKISLESFASKPSAVPTAVANLSFKSVDENVLVYDARADMIHMLSRTAGRVLQLADGTLTVDSIAERFASEYSIDGERARADVAKILAEFQRLGLLSTSLAAE